ncbi:N-terminal domain of Peptidase_S41 [Chitinophaga jiangningensis]|uniref:N-terminal domain of Peptidase_S41 n=1 Tax=Chitinophaga jiangningensis TaxID=1419482 RepID=A0A1M7ILY6_9BACT|nr:S41 family peptidase [Chitinophaga jiangningensis]SHM41655.1 N-terminal domain of Peptidase_S41 [Chitinophaga jiangningensis]
MKPLICLLLGLWSLSAAAQSPAEISYVTDTAAALIARHYVYADKGAEIAAELRRQHSNGAFSTVTSWKEYDSLATLILRKSSHDGHLYIRYSPERAIAMLENKGKAGPSEDFFHNQKARDANFGIKASNMLADNIGYLQLSMFNISDESMPLLEAAIDRIKNSRALIVDLRNNGGGGSLKGPVLESIFLPEGTAMLTFTARNGSTQTDVSMPVAADKRYHNPVYVLINKRTASAAEAFAYVMQAQGRAVVVGETSAGAANHNAMFPLNRELFISISESAPVLPGTRKSWEGTGVIPDVEVPSEQALEKALSLCKQ